MQHVFRKENLRSFRARSYFRSFPRYVIQKPAVVLRQERKFFSLNSITSYYSQFVELSGCNTFFARRTSGASIARSYFLSIARYVIQKPWVVLRQERKFFCGNSGTSYASQLVELSGYNKIFARWTSGASIARSYFLSIARYVIQKPWVVLRQERKFFSGNSGTSYGSQFIEMNECNTIFARRTSGASMREVIFGRSRDTSFKNHQ